MFGNDHNAVQRAEDKVKQIESKVNDLQRQIDSLQAENDALQKKNKTLTLSEATFKNQVDQLKRKISALQADLKSANEKNETLENRITELESQNEALQEQVDELLEKIRKSDKDFREKLSDMSARVDEAQREARNAMAKATAVATMGAQPVTQLLPVSFLRSRFSLFTIADHRRWRGSARWSAGLRLHSTHRRICPRQTRSRQAPERVAYPRLHSSLCQTEGL